MRTLLCVSLAVASAAGMATVLPQGPGGVTASHVLALTADHVIVECDDSGIWTRVFAMESEPAPDGPAGVNGAQAASRRAYGWLNRFFLGPITTKSLESGIAEAVRAPGIPGAREQAGLSADAQRQLVTGLMALREAFRTTGGSRPVVRAELGFDPDKSMVWGRRTVWNPAVAAAWTPLAQPAPSSPGGADRQTAATVGGVVGGVPAYPPRRVDRTATPPIQTYRIEPIYPVIAQAARVQGAVIIEAAIGTDGKVKDARILRSIPLLDAAALEAVRQWEWIPLKIDGVAVPVVFTVTVNFALS